MGRSPYDDEGLPGTIDVHNEYALDTLAAFSATSSPSWRPIRRPVARCEYCGRLKVSGEIQCAGCGVLR